MSHPAQRFSPRTLTVTALIALAIGVRLFIYYVPWVIPYNFTPILALGLFGGAWFTDRRSAFIVPLVAMALSDLLIGLYPMLPVIYACVAASVLLGFALRRARITPIRVILAAVGSASGFYLVTNFAVWLVSGMYPLTGTGLLASYVAGLPFYPATLAGTLFWSTALFGGYALLSRRFPKLVATPLRATSAGTSSPVH